MISVTMQYNQELQLGTVNNDKHRQHYSDFLSTSCAPKAIEHRAKVIMWRATFTASGPEKFEFFPRLAITYVNNIDMNRIRTFQAR